MQDYKKSSRISQSGIFHTHEWCLKILFLDVLQVTTNLKYSEIGELQYKGNDGES